MLVVNQWQLYQDIDNWLQIRIICILLLFSENLVAKIRKREIMFQLKAGFNVGPPQLSINYIATIRKLWKSVGYPSRSFDVKPTESTNKDVSKIVETTEGNCEDWTLEVLKKVRASNVSRLLIGNLIL